MVKPVAPLKSSQSRLLFCTYHLPYIFQEELGQLDAKHKMLMARIFELECMRGEDLPPVPATEAADIALTTPSESKKSGDLPLPLDERLSGEPKAK